MAQLNLIDSDSAIKTIYLRIAGQVQGVGFRPHVYRIATQMGINGWVRNQCSEVEILASGSTDEVDLFLQRLIEEAPTISSPHIIHQKIVDSLSRLLMLEYKDHLVPLDAALRHHDSRNFTIIVSNNDGNRSVQLPLDLDCCPRCLDELNSPANRRYHYPFINCSQCGPRYTAITQLPYDRCNTNMAIFPRCHQCEKEYSDPTDRRFHAEAIACLDCGPQLTFVENGKKINNTTTALQNTLSALEAGRIIAVKGIGGYHLLCAADNSDVIARLRRRKGRPDKPLAVMFSSIEAARVELEIDHATATLLEARSHPVVLCEKRTDSRLSSLISPGLNRTGAMLPYSPLHHLILNGLGRPVIATSANISGEPVLTDAAEAELRLTNIADAFLHHNRAIINIADDSLFQIINKKPRPLRLGRGHAPLALTLAVELDKPLLAVGGQMKNSIAIAWKNRIIISPHIGELDSPRSAEQFNKTIQSLQHHYNIKAEAIICDAHPNYYSSRWASENGLPLHKVYHHHAHASAVVGEYNIKGKSLIFTWDGSGLGEDGTLWGGEALLGRPGKWQRVATLRPFRLPGAERAARDAWRCAASLCWHASETWGNHSQAALLYRAWKNEINAPVTSSTGRLFDGATSLLRLIDNTTFEGQAAMLLQAQAENGIANQTTALPFSIDDNGVLVSDWQPLLSKLMNQQQSVAQRAMNFHNTLAHTICDQAMQMRDRHGEFVVGLNGGVFQNRLLTEQAITLLEAEGFKVYLPQQLPCNDAALCYGQIIEAVAQP